MAGQLYLFTGENAWTLEGEVRQWTRQFIAKHGEENLLRMDGETVPFRDIIDAVASAPFIAEKRLVLVRRIPRSTKEDLDRLLAAMHPAAILLFVDQEPDKRLGGVKAVFQAAEVREFPALRSAQLRQWMAAFLQAHNATATSAAVDRLLDLVGEDQQQLSMELQKLALHAGSTPIDIDQVDELVVYRAERQVWALMDLLRKGSPGPAIRYVSSLLARGESVHGIWAMMLWMLGTFAPVAAAAAESDNPATIGKQTGINPRTVRSVLPLLRGRSSGDIAAIVDRAVEYDMALKTGELRATDSEQQELIAALERLLVACCGSAQKL